jgi:lysophospholipase
LNGAGRENPKRTYLLTTLATLNNPAIEELYAQSTRGSLIGAKRVRISYRVFPSAGPEAGAVVISSGRTESTAIYKELIYDLHTQGYSVYIHDHRGQGESGRLAEGTRGHVDAFDDYIEDLHRFVRDVVKPATHKRTYLLAHSMGGGIATRYVEKYSEGITAMALVTPMHGVPALVKRVVDLGPALCTASQLRLTEALLSPTGFGTTKDGWKPETMTESDVTQSQERYDRKVDAQDDRTHIGGVTHGWFREACRATELARAEAANIKVPVLILQGGLDTAVSNRAQREFCNNVNAAGKVRCEGFALPQAKHAIFIEKDELRTPALTRILEFFADHA